MPTECSRDLFGYEVVEGRQVVAAFDGGQVDLGRRGAAAGDKGRPGMGVPTPQFGRCRTGNRR
jgi:hypothetical protein